MEIRGSQKCVCATSDLDLRSKPPVQNGIVSSQDVTHNPQTSIETGDVVDFFISGKGEEYNDFANSYITVEGKIVKADGTDIDANAKVAVINNTVHCLQSQVDVIANDVLITPSHNLYAYRAYIETLMSYRCEAEYSFLSAAMFVKEDAGKMHLTTDENKSFIYRKGMCAQSKTFQCQGRLHTELCHQMKPLINGVDVKIRLVKSSSPFVIIKADDDNENYQVKITQVTFTVRK